MNRKVIFLNNRPFKNAEEIERLLLAVNDNITNGLLRLHLSRLLPAGFHLSFQTGARKWCMVDYHGKAHILEITEKSENKEIYLS